MKKVNIGYETLADIVAKLGVLAGADNKIRFAIGLKDTGNGLACWATIVNGGAMMKAAFKTNPPKTKVELEEGKPYVEFACKAHDFITMASALLPYKADVTLTDGDGKVVLSCASGTKVPVGKVAAETLEPLLPEDYDDRIALFKGAAVVETLEKGGVAATFDGGTDVSGRIDGGRLEVCAVARNGFSRYGCGVAVERKTEAEKAPEAQAEEITEASEETLTEAKRFLVAHMGTLTDEAQQQAFRGKVAEVVNDPVALLKVAAEAGWKNPAAKAEEPKAEEPAAPSMFYLTVASWRLLTKLFAGCEDATYLLTPKSLHVSGKKVRATFALANESKNVWGMLDRIDRNERTIKIVCDRDAIRSTMSVMKLGDPKKAFKLSASAKGLLFDKVEEGIQSLVPILSSAGSLEGFSRFFSSTLFGDCVGILKAGNVLLSFTDDGRFPISLSNGSVEEMGPGYVGLMPVDPRTVAAEEEAAKKKAAEAAAKKEAEKASDEDGEE